MSGQRVYIHPNETQDNYKAVYLRLPTSIQRPVDGCTCDYCNAHPGLPAAWDTLVIPLDGLPTWACHWPTLEQTASLL